MKTIIILISYIVLQNLEKKTLVRKSQLRYEKFGSLRRCNMILEIRKDASFFYFSFSTRIKFHSVTVSSV